MNIRSLFSAIMFHGLTAPVVQFRASILGASLLVCISGSFAAEEADWLEQMQAQEELLAELESAHGPLNLSLVEPLQAMTELLREQSELERVAGLQERQLTLMRVNLGLESPQLLPLLEAMVVNQIALGDSGKVVDHLQQIRNLSSPGGDADTLLNRIDAQAHWLLTGGAGRNHRQRVAGFFDARELINELESLARETFSEDDPAIVPWLYLGAMNRYQMVGLLSGWSGIGDRATRKLLRQDGMARLGRRGGDMRASNFAQRTSRGRYTLRGELYLREAMDNFQEIAELLARAGDIEGQAMAKIYRADFRLLANWTSAFQEYDEAIELLHEAEVPAERIAHFFSRPQLLPMNRFHPTLEQAIDHQEAALSSWRPAGEEVNYVAPFVAWSETAPTVREPLSDNAFWETVASYHQVDFEFNIDSRGNVSAVEVLGAEPEDRTTRRLARDSMQIIRFRPILEPGRRLGLRDVHMRFLLPRGDG